MGGEAEVTASRLATGFIVESAATFGGAMFALEHRFYGESQPFPTLDTSNLRWLSSQQALADAATFITAMTNQFNLSTHPWFVIGGSYPGALSAWFRIHYPHLVVGSLASSAPVFAKADFFEYDQAVAASAGDVCADLIRNATSAVEAALDTDPVATKTRFACQGIDDNVNFLYIIADAVAYAIQYTSDNAGPRYHLKEQLCETMAEPSDPVTNYVTFFSNLLTLTQTTCESFSTWDVALQNVSNAPSLNQRQWYYQSCAEFGYFQTAPAVKPLRSSRITLQYHLDLCQRVFSVNGTDLAVPLYPMIDSTQTLNGGMSPHGTNIFFTNGDIDPWHVLGVTQNLSCCPSEIAYLIHGTSHCADLGPSSSSDPPALTAARAEVTAQIRQVLKEPQVEACPRYLTSCSGICVDITNDPANCGQCGRSVNDFTSQFCSRGQISSITTQTTVGTEYIIIGVTMGLIGIGALAYGLFALRRSNKSLDYSAM